MHGRSSNRNAFTSALSGPFTTLLTARSHSPLPFNQAFEALERRMKSRILFTSLFNHLDRVNYCRMVSVAKFFANRRQRSTYKLAAQVHADLPGESKVPS